MNENRLLLASVCKSDNFFLFLVGFWGGIIDITSLGDGLLFAKSLYRWHCYDFRSAAIATKWNPLFQDALATLLTSGQLVCRGSMPYERGLCWQPNGALPTTDLVAAHKNGDCRIDRRNDLVIIARFYLH